MPHVRSSAGPIAIAAAALCSAWAGEQPAAPAATPAVSEATAVRPTDQFLALAPGPHLYMRIPITPDLDRGEAAHPAWIRLSTARKATSAELAIGSGNASFDRAALAQAADSRLSYAGVGNAPPLTMICASSNDDCPEDSPWSDGISLRSMSDIQAGFDRYKVELITAYRRAIRRRDIEGEGTVVLDFAIEPSGDVVQCSVTQSSFGSQAFQESVVEAVRDFNFGAKPVARTRYHGFPISFHPL
jgi:TonB family protein